MLNAIIALGFATALAWAIGRVATDSIPAIQPLHWIPTIAAIIVTVLACVCAGVARRRRALLALLAVAALQAIAFLAQDWHPWRRTTESVEAGPGRVRLVHFNANWPGATSLRVAEAMAHVTRLAFGPQGADIVLLSERGDILASAEGAGMIPEGVRSIVVGRFGVISRVRVLRATPLFDDGSVAGALIELEVMPGRDPMRVVLIDAPSSPGLSRAAVMASLRQGIDRSVVGAPDLVVGDFNTPHGSASVGGAMSALRDAWDLSGAGWGGTFPRTAPLWRIDQIWCGARVTPLVCATADPGIGQHRAQVAVLELLPTQSH